MKPTLLLLSGGSQVAQFILAALEERRDLLHLIATSSVSDDPGLWSFDKVYLAPVTATQPEAFRERLLEVVSRERVDLIVPCRDDDVLALAESAQVHPELAPRALCGSADLARMMSDKWASWLFCEKHGLPHARSLIAGCERSAEQFVREVGYPLVSKPRDGFSSRGIFLIENDEQLRRALQRPNYVLQEYLEQPDVFWSFRQRIETEGLPLLHSLRGLKVGIQVMIAPAGRAPRVFATYTKHGYGVTTMKPNDDPEALELGRRCGEVFSSVGWRGPLNVQCQRDRRGRVTIHEFSGRFAGSTAARLMLGYDQLADGLEAFTGFRLPVSNWQTNPASVVVSRLASKASDPADVGRLQTRGEWSSRVRD